MKVKKVNNVETKMLHFKHKLTGLSSREIITVPVTFYINEKKRTVVCKINNYALAHDILIFCTEQVDSKKVKKVLTDFNVLSKNAEPFNLGKLLWDNSPLEILGKAKCSPKDTFDKYAGMDIAFNRAYTTYSKIHKEVINIVKERLDAAIDNSYNEDHIKSYFIKMIATNRS